MNDILQDYWFIYLIEEILRCKKVSQLVMVKNASKKALKSEIITNEKYALISEVYWDYRKKLELGDFIKI